jgi:hypothetical protein
VSERSISHHLPQHGQRPALFVEMLVDALGKGGCGCVEACLNLYPLPSSQLVAQHDAHGYGGHTRHGHGAHQEVRLEGPGTRPLQGEPADTWQMAKHTTAVSAHRQ